MDKKRKWKENNKKKFDIFLLYMLLKSIVIIENKSPKKQHKVKCKKGSLITRIFHENITLKNITICILPFLSIDIKNFLIRF